MAAPPPPPPHYGAVPPPPSSAPLYHTDPYGHLSYVHRPSFHRPPDSNDAIRTIFVSGLPQDVKPREVHNLFARRFGFDSCQLKYTGRGNQVVAFVTFLDHLSAVLAMGEFNGLVFDPETGSKLNVELARSNSRPSKWTPSTPDQVPEFDTCMFYLFSEGMFYLMIQVCATEKRTRDVEESHLFIFLLRVKYTFISLFLVLHVCLLFLLGGPGGFYSVIDNRVKIAKKQVICDNGDDGSDSDSDRSGGKDSLHGAQSVEVNEKKNDSQIVKNDNQEKSAPNEVQPCSTLFIANLGTSCTEEELKGILSAFSGFQTLKMRGRKGSPVAFADFKDTESSTEAKKSLQGMKLSSSDTDGIDVEYAKSKMRKT